MVSAMDISKPGRVVREVVANVEEEEEDVVRKRETIEMGVVSKLTSPCLEEVDNALCINA